MVALGRSHREWQAPKKLGLTSLIDIIEISLFPGEKTVLWILVKLSFERALETQKLLCRFITQREYAG
jgi:hypothetical protein